MTASEEQEKPVLDGELLQSIADGELPKQLAGATAALQEQLAAITREMQTLKSEMYSEQHGLTAQLSEIAQRAQDLQGGGDHVTSSVAAPTLRGRPGRPLEGDGKPSGSRTVMANELDARPSSGAQRRRVEFTPDTHDPVPMRQRGGLARVRPVAQSQPGWTPYIIGFGLMCIGPLRPLVYELFKSLPSLLSGLASWLMSGGGEEELAWYEQ
mmetsp:Transcript_35538/g.93279  ORF Transcript_35538/g.93279 Transcript_35538/m.93279 type:complete len:212 (-) Transcript_35538:301-936(-)